MSAEKLAALRTLSQLRADRTGVRLARIQAAIDTLEGRRKALLDRAPDLPATVAEAAMQDRWLRWRGEQLGHLASQVARLQAEAQPHREAHAKETARTAVLGKIEPRRRR